MHASFLQVLLFLAAGIAVIVVLTVKYRVPAFFALLLACFVTGLGTGMPVEEVLTSIKTGFGEIMKSLSLIIVLGTTLGVLLEHSGCTEVMAAYILKKVGEGRASLAISITGYVVGLPVFCDSGYIVLNGLNKALIIRTGMPAAVMSISLASGLYSVHCLIPPHPGAAAAASTIGVDFGKLILFGMMVAIPSMLAGYWWARFAGAKTTDTVMDDGASNKNRDSLPRVLPAFLPVIIPILLIAIRSFIQEDLMQVHPWTRILHVAGEPVIALAMGILLTLLVKKQWPKYSISPLLQEAVEKAGGILIIIGAGGAFGAVLAATRIGNHFSESVSLNGIGILFPFLLTSLIKTAQGSSTVAIITAASIIKPLLPTLGLDSGDGQLMAVLAMGAGSMMVSHTNDAYFWVISKFSGLSIRTMLKVHSLASVFMGIAAMAAIYILSIILK